MSMIPATLTAPNTESDKDALANIYRRRNELPSEQQEGMCGESHVSCL